MKKVIFNVGIMLLSMGSLTACSNGDDEVKNHPEPDEVTEIGIWPHHGTDKTSLQACTHYVISGEQLLLYYNHNKNFLVFNQLSE